MEALLAIESSCDETAAAVIVDGKICSNCVAGQEIHSRYGGVVPELASRAHQENIVPVVEMALREAGVAQKDLKAIAFTRGPGLMGSLVVGTAFAKAYALGLGIPLIEINHMQAHILAHFIEDPKPDFPFICLTVSGGHTQLVLVEDYFEMRLLGQTLDDAAGEAFDKSAKILGLPYPGGPLIDRYAQLGDSQRFRFPKGKVDGLNFSFSGLKTAVLYFVEKQKNTDPDFVQNNLNDLCASIQKAILDGLIDKSLLAMEQTGVKRLAIAGGVSANSGLRERLMALSVKGEIQTFIPKFEYCTDNAAMIAMSAWFKYKKQIFTTQETTPDARLRLF